MLCVNEGVLHNCTELTNLKPDQLLILWISEVLQVGQGNILWSKGCGKFIWDHLPKIPVGSTLFQINFEVLYAHSLRYTLHKN